MNSNCSNQKPNSLKPKRKRNKKIQIDKNTREHMANRVGNYFPKGGHSAIQTELKSIRNKYKVKHHRNSDTQTDNRELT